MMTKLKKAVEQLVQQEYSLASEQHGAKFHSPHEAYAVIKEEIEEAYTELSEVCRLLEDVYWHCVKDNDIEPIEAICNSINIHAQNLAAESIQVAAMAHKALQSCDI